MAQQQAGGIVEGDERGKHKPSNKTDPEIIESLISHVSSFSKYECHYIPQRSKRFSRFINRNEFALIEKNGIDKEPFQISKSITLQVRE